MQDSLHCQVYLIFEDSTSAFATQRILSSPLLSEYNFSLGLVPTPREYSNNCNLAVLLKWSEDSQEDNKAEFIESIHTLLAQKHIKHDIIYS